VCRTGPQHLRRRTRWPTARASESGQERTLALQLSAPPFDDLVGGGEQIGRDREAERLRGLAGEKSVQNLSGRS
jgi:hypothetical protein